MKKACEKPPGDDLEGWKAAGLGRAVLVTDSNKDLSVPKAPKKVDTLYRTRCVPSSGWWVESGQETVTAPCALRIAGAGHISQAVAPLALQLDFGVTVFDDWPALASHQCFPQNAALKAEI